MKKIAASIVLIVLFFSSSCYYDNEEDLYQFVEQQTCTIAATDVVSFAAQIMPTLTTHCIRCHRTGREDGGVNLEDYNQVKPYVDNGSLYGTTNHEVGFPVMPTSGVKIPFCEIEQMRIWIENGAANN